MEFVQLHFQLLTSIG